MNRHGSKESLWSLVEGFIGRKEVLERPVPFFLLSFTLRRSSSRATGIPDFANAEA